MPVLFANVENNLYRSGDMDINEVPILKNVWGIDCIVSLDEDVADKIHSQVKSCTIDHVVFPFNFNAEDVLDVFSDLCELVKSLGLQKTLIHCLHGKDRTGLAVAIHRINNGWSADQAIGEALMFGFGKNTDKLISKLCQKLLKQYANDINSANDSDIVSLSKEQCPEPMPTENAIGGYCYPPYPPEKQQISPLRINMDEWIKTVDINDAMAQVGVNDGANPILKGINPIETTGYMPSSYSFAT